MKKYLIRDVILGIVIVIGLFWVIMNCSYVLAEDNEYIVSSTDSYDGSIHNYIKSIDGNYIYDGRAQGEYNVGSIMVTATGFSTQKDLLKNSDYSKKIIGGYMHFGIYNTWSANAPNTVRHIMCSHSSSGGHIYYGQIQEILDIGYSSNNNAISIQSPSYVYSYKDKRSKTISSPSTILQYLALESYRTESSSDRVIISYAMQDIITKLHNSKFLDSSIYNFDVYDGGAFDKKKDGKYTNFSWISYVFNSGNDNGYYYNSKDGKKNTDIYENVKNVYDSESNASKFSTSKILTSEKKTIGEGDVYNSEDLIVGPFKVILPNLSKYDGKNDDFGKIEIKDKNDSNNRGILCDKNGKNITKITSNSNFYIKFNKSIPENVEIALTYQQFYGKIIFSNGGNGQPEIIIRGGKGTNKSSVTYEIKKNTDIIVNNSIMWVDSDKEKVNFYKDSNGDYNRNNYSDKDKNEQPVYVETGDIVKARVKISNKYSKGTVSKYYLDFANNIEKATIDHINTKQPSQNYINEFLSSVSNNSVRNLFIEKRFNSNNEYKSADSANTLLSNINVNTSGYDNYYMMYVSGGQTSSISDIFDTKAQVKEEDVSPDDEDASNNLSYDYMRLKAIDANITKTYDKTLKKEGSKYIELTTQRASDNTPLLEYGNYVSYKVEVSNPGQSSDSASNLYNVTYREEVPDGLKLVKVEKNNTSILTTSRLNSANQDGYIEFSDNIQVGKKVTYYFTYLVESYGDNSTENTYQSITNTANIEKFCNRNGIEYTNNKSSSAKIYVRNYGVRIDKYLYQNTYGTDGNKTTENITDRKGKTDEEKRNNPYYSEYGDILTYRFEITNTGSADISGYCMQDVYDPKEFRFINPKEIVIENGVEVKKDWSGTAKLIPKYVENRLYYFWAGSQNKTLSPGETFVFELQFEVINQNTSNSNESLLLEDSFELTRIVSNNNTIIFTEEDGYKVNTGNSGVEEYQDGESQNHLIVNSQVISKEFTIERFYNVETSKYISGYDGKMMYENIQNDLITLDDEYEDYYEGSIEEFGINRRYLSEEEKLEKPFAVEKSETVTYTIKVENKKSENESNDAKTYISNIMDYLDFGLEKDKASFEVKLKQNDNFKTFIQDKDYGISDIDKYTDSFVLIFPNSIELLPGDYIEINYKVKITCSNMELEVLKNEAILTQIKNRNNQVIIEQSSLEPPIDTGLNITSTISTEVVKLKDLVISGYIWGDLNKNGLKEDNEPGIEGIEVTLNGLDENSKENRYTTVYTDSNGLYTFGRVFRTNENNEYEDSLYISYNYDGVKYQSTIYSGKDNLVYEDNAYHMKPDYKIDSNAREFDYSGNTLGRIDFNNSLKTIYYNYSSEEFIPTENDIELNYNKQDSVSTRVANVSSENTALIKSYSFLNYNDNGEEQIDYLWFENPRDNEYETEYLKYINLGLVLRDELDLSVSENLESITNTVFGDKFTYKYSQDDKEEFQYYSSDYYYKYSNYNDETIREYLTDESELTSQIKYKVTLQNQGIQNDNVIVQVNELSLYLDEKYTIQTNEDGKISSITMKVLNKDELFEDEEISLVDAYFIDGSGNKIYLDVYKDSIYYPLENEHNGYTPLYIRPRESDNLTGIIIENGGATDLYLTFVDCKRSDEYDKYIDLGIYNHVIEISAYSTYYKDYSNSHENERANLEQPGKGAGYVDIDSNPGNLGLGKYSHEYIYNNFEELFINKLIRDFNGDFENFWLIDTYNDYLNKFREYESIEDWYATMIEGYRRDYLLYAQGFGNAFMNLTEWFNSEYGYNKYQKNFTYKFFMKIHKDATSGTNSPIDFDELYNLINAYVDLFGEDFIKYDEDDTCRGSIRLYTYTGPDSGGDTETGDGSGGGTGSGDGSGSGTGTGTGGGNQPEEPLERKVTGIVFDDCRSELVQDEDGSNVQYIGNGLYATTDTKANKARTNSNPKLSGKEESDSLVNGVTAELYQTIKIPVKFEDGTTQIRYYEVNLNDIKQYNIPVYNSDEESYVSKVIDKSGYGDNKNEGEYTLSGFTPGTHFVRFSYGNNQEDDNMLIFNGQDYKSTSMANYQEDIERGILTYRDLQNSEITDKDKENEFIYKLQQEGQPPDFWVTEYMVNSIENYIDNSETTSIENWYAQLVYDLQNAGYSGSSVSNIGTTFANYYIGKYGPDGINTANNRLIQLIGGDFSKNIQDIDYRALHELVNSVYNEIYQSEQYEYKDEIKKYIETTNGSKAIDDAQRRLEVNLYSGEINNEKSEILRSGYEITSGNLNGESASKNTMYELLSSVFIENTNMFADSIEFYVRTENEDFINENKDYIDSIKYKDRNHYSLNNLSFGLQYRPETELTEYEYVKEIIIESATDKDFLHLYFTEDKKLDETKDNKGLANVQQIDSVVNFSDKKGRYDFTKGFKFVNVDEEFLQGATLYVIYGIYVDNTGEIDRIGKSLYENSTGTENFEDITRAELINNIQNAIESYDIDYYDAYGSNTETNIYNDNFVGQTIRKYVSNYDSNIENHIYSDIYDWYIRSSNTASRTTGLIGEFDLIYNNIENTEEYYRGFEQYKNLLQTLNPNAYYNTTLYKFVEHISSQNRGTLDGYFDISTLIQELKSDFIKYDALRDELKKNNKEHLYRTDRKLYDEYYCKYLGTTYYGIEVTEEDAIATVKIDQIIDNIDQQMQFNSIDYQQDWKYYNNINDIKNHGAYFFIEDYNLGDSELTEEGLNNIFMQDIKRYFNLYNSMGDLLIDGKLTNEGKKWYESLISSLLETLDKYSYLEQGISNQMNGLTTELTDYYSSEYAEKYGANVIFEGQEFMRAITSDLNRYTKLTQITDAEGKPKTVYQLSEIDEESYSKVAEYLSNEEAYSRFYNYIDSRTSYVTSTKKTDDSNDISFKWKVLESQLIEEENPNEYNTTYKFIQPQQNNEEDTTEKTNATKEYKLVNENDLNTRVSIDIVTQVTISSDIFEHTDLSFDNISEVSMFYSVGGRKTIQESSPGNGDQHDIISDASVEHVTFTPPTGLSQNAQKVEKAKTEVIIVIIGGMIILVIAGGIYKIKSCKKRLKQDKHFK